MQLSFFVVFLYRADLQSFSCITLVSLIVWLISRFPRLSDFPLTDLFLSTESNSVFGFETWINTVSFTLTSIFSHLSFLCLNAVVKLWQGLWCCRDVQLKFLRSVHEYKTRLETDTQPRWGFVPLHQWGHIRVKHRENISDVGKCINIYLIFFTYLLLLLNLLLDIFNNFLFYWKITYF